MIVYLVKDPKDAALWIDEKRLRVFEGRRFQRTTDSAFESAGKAEEEARRLIARKVKSGWRVIHEVESPWQKWLDGLETLQTRIVRDAESQGVRITSRSLQLSFPSSPPKVPGEWAEFESVSALMRFRLGLERDNLAFDEQFEIAIPARDFATIEAWRSGALTKLPFWRRRDPISGTTLEEGSVDLTTGTLVSDLGGRLVRHATAAEFREWWPGYIRNDVFTQEIGELAGG